MSKPLSSLALRLISSAILIPIVFGVIFVGGWAYATVAALCIAIALSEWVNISRYIPAYKLPLIGLGILYLSASYLEMISLRGQEFGAYWTIIFMLSIWASDSGAYLFGKTIGGKKMSPTISPNKTWAGYVGALLFPALILFIATQIVPPDFLIDKAFAPSGTMAVITGIAIGIAGQSGDLMISAMKRKAGLKDTGALIPGHGGILDRIDALLLALPVYMAYIKFITEQ